jgi:hypothetical protein
MPTSKERYYAHRNLKRTAKLGALRGYFVPTRVLPANIKTLREALHGVHMRLQAQGMGSGGIGNFVVNGNPYSQASVNKLAGIVHALNGSPAFNKLSVSFARSVLQRLYQQLQTQASQINRENVRLQNQIRDLQHGLATVRAHRPSVPTRKQERNQWERIRGLAGVIAYRGVTPLGGARRRPNSGPGRKGLLPLKPRRKHNS